MQCFALTNTDFHLMATVLQCQSQINFFLIITVGCAFRAAFFCTLVCEFFQFGFLDVLVYGHSIPRCQEPRCCMRERGHPCKIKQKTLEERLKDISYEARKSARKLVLGSCSTVFLAFSQTCLYSFFHSLYQTQSLFLTGTNLAVENTTEAAADRKKYKSRFKQEFMKRKVYELRLN